MQPENLIAITNADAIYTFTSRGGGLQSVELTKYPDTIPLRWKKEMATNGFATLNIGAPAPMLAIVGDPGLVGDGSFHFDENRRRCARGKKIAGWFAARERISHQFQLPCQREREPEK